MGTSPEDSIGEPDPHGLRRPRELTGAGASDDGGEGSRTTSHRRSRPWPAGGSAALVRGGRRAGRHGTRRRRFAEPAQAVGPRRACTAISAPISSAPTTSAAPPTATAPLTPTSAPSHPSVMPLPVRMPLPIIE